MEPYFLERIHGSCRAVRNATHTVGHKEKTRPVTYTQSRTPSVRSIELVIIFLNPRTGKMKRILPSDCLPSPSCHLGVSRFSPASSCYGHIINPLLTKREVKMSGYWPRSFLLAWSITHTSIPIASIDAKTTLASCYRHIVKIFL